MIYDCFLFFNELDLLKIRLNELNDSVDKFVLVESSKTFSGKNKPFYFEKNKTKFKKFLPKIIHLKISDFSGVKTTKLFIEKSHFTFVKKNFNTWANEFFQRNYISKGLSDCRDNDIILISDVDEIPNKNVFKRLNNLKGIAGFEQDVFYYYLNNHSDQKIIGTRAIRKKFLTSPQEIRMATNYKVIKNAGWHFSFLGGINQIKKKIKSFSHQEYNQKHFMDSAHLLFNINNGLDIFNRPLSFEQYNELLLPNYIQKNRNTYKKHFKEFLKTSQDILDLKKEIISLRQKLLNIKIKKNNRITQLKNTLNSIYQSKYWKIYTFLKNATSH